jgi:2-dehydro-3-deoxygluconokinase
MAAGAHFAMTPPLDILSIGEPMIEYNQLPAGRGGRADGALFLRGPGGDASNFAVAAARHGARVGMLTRLGADEHGAAIRALWAEEGIDAAAVLSDPAAPTGVYFVSHGPDGHAFSFARQGSAASRHAPSDLPADLVARARHLHVTGVTLAISTASADAAFEAMDRMRAAGRRVSFDTNLRLRLWPLARARALIREALRLCDVALPSMDDLERLADLRDPRAAMDWCLGHGPKIVALKCGGEGALLWDGRQTLQIPPFPCRPVDATGAGDAFGGAFVARWLAGESVAAAGRYAAAVAAIATEGYGAVAPVPDRAAALARMGAEAQAGDKAADAS